MFHIGNWLSNFLFANFQSPPNPLFPHPVSLVLKLSLLSSVRFNPIADVRCLFLSYLISYLGQKAGLLLSVPTLEPILCRYKTEKVIQDTDVYKDTQMKVWKLVYYDYLF
jgi:hypothetical protein